MTGFASRPRPAIVAWQSVLVVARRRLGVDTVIGRWPDGATDDEVDGSTTVCADIRIRSVNKHLTVDDNQERAFALTDPTGVYSHYSAQTSHSHRLKPLDSDLHDVDGSDDEASGFSRMPMVVPFRCKRKCLIMYPSACTRMWKTFESMQLNAVVVGLSSSRGFASFIFDALIVASGQRPFYKVTMTTCSPKYGEVRTTE
ncbi:unnamed protein product [Soboliphyme baturini]|uniref:Uncharacterized protein n=1 Tax=Soboliphyme baturini TaxID=241478 RepID=A0A183IQY6_9BILA|nr:unnamed protein product [Soboliphyme baturini]